MKKQLLKIKGAVARLCAALFIFLAIPEFVFAETIGESKLGTGAIKLVNDITTLLIILGVAVAGAAGVWHLIKRSMADEQEAKVQNKKVTAAIVSGVGVTVFAAVIKIITSYFA
jgi:hypothetical protein